MRLNFVRTHDSIKEFPITELPAFTIITGLNGSGKSHLLQAILQGRISADVAPNHLTETRIFTWTDMVPQDTGGFSGGQIAQERDQLFQQFRGIKSQLEDIVRAPARNAGITGLLLNDIKTLATHSIEQFQELGLDAIAATQLHTSIKNGVLQASNQVLTSWQHQPNLFEEINSVSSAVSKPIILLDEEDFKPAKSPNWGKSQPFQQQFGKLFCQYAELVKANTLKRCYGEPALSDQEFAATYMMAPWDFVNETLSIAGLGFEINQPDRTDNTVFTPRLTKTSTGDEIQFGSLSSGEKVIMSFALCMYYASEGRQLTTYPKLLLLDEIDAPLHPSMCKHFLNTITDVLVKKLGVNVIATTHSPSTVALAPEESIHVMQVGKPGVHKTTKAEALNLLTAGVPIVSIDYSGRRQVFVESPRDAEFHSKLFQIMKDSKYILSERSLEFLSTGTTNPNTGSDQNTGCSNVESVVESLVKCGNKSVFGFIDWDLVSNDKERVFVLLKNERYSIENFAFDPLAILALISKDPREYDAVKQFGIPATFNEFSRSDYNRYQSAIDKVIEKIMPEDNHSEKLQVSYLGGTILSVSKVYLHKNGHELQEKILSTFPAFRKYLKNLPPVDMIQEVYRELPAIIPKGIDDCYNRVLNHASH